MFTWRILTGWQVLIKVDPRNQNKNFHSYFKYKPVIGQSFSDDLQLDYGCVLLDITLKGLTKLSAILKQVKLHHDCVQCVEQNSTILDSLVWMKSASRKNKTEA